MQPPQAAGIPRLLPPPPQDDLTHICFRDPFYLDHHGGRIPTPHHALEYLALSRDFYDPACINETIKMQTRFNSNIDFASIDASAMTGIEYYVWYHDMIRQNFHVIKSFRMSRTDSLPMAVYYCVDGTFYQAPDLYALITSRLRSSLRSLNDSFALFSKHSIFDPATGYVWDTALPKEKKQMKSKSPRTSSKAPSKKSIKKNKSTSSDVQDEVPTDNNDERDAFEKAGTFETTAQVTNETKPVENVKRRRKKEKTLAAEVEKTRRKKYQSKITVSQVDQNMLHAEFTRRVDMLIAQGNVHNDVSFVLPASLPQKKSGKNDTASADDCDAAGDISTTANAGAPPDSLTHAERIDVLGMSSNASSTAFAGQGIASSVLKSTSSSRQKRFKKSASDDNLDDDCGNSDGNDDDDADDDYKSNTDAGAPLSKNSTTSSYRRKRKRRSQERASSSGKSRSSRRSTKSKNRIEREGN